MKVDFDCDGTVTWAEYMNYQLLEGRQVEATRSDTDWRSLPTTVRCLLQPSYKTSGVAGDVIGRRRNQVNDDVIRIIQCPSTVRAGHLYQVGTCDHS